jgi:type VI secretion system protein ImpJ
MTMQAVHWHEGMFMRPHHFQASNRYLLEQIRRGHKWDVHYSWGLRAVDIDLDALANHRLVVRRLEARFHDGTMAEFEDRAPGTTLPLSRSSSSAGTSGKGTEIRLAERDLKAALLRRNPLLVFLAVPALNLGRPNAALSQNGAVRYLVDSWPCSDENTGGNPQELSIRRLNLKLLLEGEDQTGYQTLPLARIRKSERAEATPELDDTFIPPLLSCDSWQFLQDGILQAIYERLRKKIDFLAKQIADQGITFDRRAQGDALILQQLRYLNEAFGVLHVLLFAQAVHPLAAFLELNRVVGQLAVFSAARRVPDLPRYDHDDLYKCFSEIKQALDDFLDIVAEPEYRERPFVGAGLRMQVALEPSWLEASWQLFVGVRSSLSEEACVQLLTRPGELDMKIGSSDRVEEVFRQGHQGLRFELQKRPPRALPAGAGWIFFQVKRQPQDREWQHVLQSLHLALRINERLIASPIQNQRMLTIRTPNKTTTMEFMLFAVPPDKV